MRTKLLIARGAIVIAAGIVGWLSPAPTIATLAVLFGGFALLDSCVALAMVFIPRDSVRWATTLWVEAMVSVGAGMSTLLLRDPSANMLAVIVATWATVTGVVELVTTRRVAGDAAARSLVGVAAGCALATGLLFFFHGGGRLFLLLVAVLAFGVGVTLGFVALRAQRLLSGRVDPVGARPRV